MFVVYFLCLLTALAFGAAMCAGVGDFTRNLLQVLLPCTVLQVFILAGLYERGVFSTFKVYPESVLFVTAVLVTHMISSQFHLRLRSAAGASGTPEGSIVSVEDLKGNHGGEASVARS